VRIAINGTGVAGPALAYWLKRFGHEPTLFEQAPALRTGGYLIDFWGLGYELAERMGIIGTLRAQSYLMERLTMVDRCGAQVAGLDVRPLRAAVNGRFISLERSELAAALFRACGGVPAHFGTSVVGLAQDAEGVTVTLSDGSRARFDLVVGADGLHSKVRSLVFGSDALCEVPLGCHVAAFRLSNYPHRDELAYVSHTEPKRQAARVALRGGQTLVLLIFRSELIAGDPPPSQQKAAIRRAFEHMGWEVPEMLDRMDEVEDLYFDRVSQIHLGRWCSGRVALLGDAAACASLLAGEGTGLAMVEAYVLAGEIHRAKGDLETALGAYEAHLLGFVRAKQKSALRLRGFFAPRTPLGLRVRNFAVNTFDVPWFGKRLVSNALADDFHLPNYG
jgi:2-polyprenyl-6-methoxyphenol hydroxylase-like FAD-dependent oxidoreductase